MKVYGHVDAIVLLRCKDYEHYYTDQVGGRIPFVFSEYGVDQSGEGFGSFLRSLWRVFRPVVVSGAKAVGNQALSSLGGYMGDLASGSNWKTAGQARLNEAETNLHEKLQSKLSKMTGSGMPQYIPASYRPEGAAAKVLRMTTGLNAKRHKRSTPKLNAFSICAPPNKTGRDLRIKRRLVKNKFRGSKVSKRVSARIAKKKQANQRGKGFDCWL
jgi:hypothetical protein